MYSLKRQDEGLVNSLEKITNTLFDGWLNFYERIVIGFHIASMWISHPTNATRQVKTLYGMLSWMQILVPRTYFSLISVLTKLFITYIGISSISKVSKGTVHAKQVALIDCIWMQRKSRSFDTNPRSKAWIYKAAIACF